MAATVMVILVLRILCGTQHSHHCLLIIAGVAVFGIAIVAI